MNINSFKKKSSKEILEELFGNKLENEQSSFFNSSVFKNGEPQESQSFTNLTAAREVNQNNPQENNNNVEEHLISENQSTIQPIVAQIPTTEENSTANTIEKHKN